MRLIELLVSFPGQCLRGGIYLALRQNKVAGLPEERQVCLIVGVPSVVRGHLRGPSPLLTGLEEVTEGETCQHSIQELPVISPNFEARIPPERARVPGGLDLTE